MNRGPIGQQGQQGMRGMPGSKGERGDPGYIVNEYPPYYWDIINNYKRCVKIWNDYAKITARPLCVNAAHENFTYEHQMHIAKTHTKALEKRLTKHKLGQHND